jgi:hypothetical protein
MSDSSLYPVGESHFTMRLRRAELHPTQRCCSEFKKIDMSLGNSIRVLPAFHQCRWTAEWLWSDWSFPRHFSTLELGHHEPLWVSRTEKLSLPCGTDRWWAGLISYTIKAIITAGVVWPEFSSPASANDATSSMSDGFRVSFIFPHGQCDCNSRVLVWVRVEPVNSFVSTKRFWVEENFPLECCSRAGERLLPRITASWQTIGNVFMWKHSRTNVRLAWSTNIDEHAVCSLLSSVSVYTFLNFSRRF